MWTWMCLESMEDTDTESRLTMSDIDVSNPKQRSFFRSSVQHLCIDDRARKAPHASQCGKYWRALGRPEDPEMT